MTHLKRRELNQKNQRKIGNSIRSQKSLKETIRIKNKAGKKKNGKDIASLIRLNEARKKMRSSLGMDLQISTEKAMENYWVLGDFLNQGESKKNKIATLQV